MAFVAALPAISAVAGIAGAGISAMGAIQQGNATAAAANYQAAVARNNAQIANQNAEYSIQAGQAKAEKESMKGAERLAKVKTAIAANGIDVNTGSAADVQESQRETDKLDTETVMSNAELQAYGYRSNATSFNAQAGLHEATAKEAPIAAGFNAAGGLLSSASSIGMKWSGASGGADPGVAAFNSGASIY